MKKENALKKIDEIHAVLLGANRLLFSGRQMISIGILLLAVPLIYFTTDGLTFDLDILKQRPELTRFLRGIFFGGLFYLVGKYGPGRTERAPILHPMLAKTFNFERTLAILIFLTGITLVGTGHGSLVVPFVLILLGFMFNIMSRHAIPTVRLASWGLMTGGIAYIWLQHFFEFSRMWMIGVAWLGVMFLWLGFSSLKTVQVELEHGT